MSVVVADETCVQRSGLNERRRRQAAPGDVDDEAVGILAR